ncbi:hypothetical protein NPIL_574841 [Nephila pilipes]|uniref:Uncharacterized protein n=1 Tax=Nephila pilipes TaxID=299642 RepID=A0A8X6N955_NEPPI|nr:hypothetical protein NPIL_574841 [Nephila pilipes]
MLEHISHFDGELETIHVALQQLAVRLDTFERAVIFSDSLSALQALSIDQETLRVQRCGILLKEFKGKWSLQWVHLIVVFGEMKLLIF